MEEARFIGLGSYRRRGADDGYSVVELMVVLTIVGVLLAIAVPTYLGGRAGSRDRAAQSDLRTALSSLEAYRAEHGAYTDDLTSLADHDRSLPWTSGDAQAGIAVRLPLEGDDRAVCLSRQGDGSVFVIARVASGEGSGTYFGDAACPSDVSDLSTWSTGGWGS